MTFEDLLDILAEQFSCDAAELSEDTSFEDLGVDAEYLCLRLFRLDCSMLWLCSSETLHLLSLLWEHAGSQRTLALRSLEQLSYRMQ